MQADPNKKLLRRCADIVEEFNIDLSGSLVMTECANGAFVSTALIAALAGADVVAIGTSNSHGEYLEKKLATINSARDLGVASRITVVNSIEEGEFSSFDVITNLGAVRPIQSSMIDCLKVGSIVALMCEAWETRPEDVDITYAKDRQILVLETSENNPLLRTFDYLGPVAMKLLSEADGELFFGKIVIVGSGVFANSIALFFKRLGRDCFSISPSKEGWEIEFAREILEPCTVIFAENQVLKDLLPPEAIRAIAPRKVDRYAFIHIAGALGTEALDFIRGNVYPSQVADFPRMSTTTHFVGSEPVVRLHAAGLAGTATVLKGLKNGMNDGELNLELEKQGFARLV